MNKTFFKIGLGLLLLAGLAWPSRGDVAGVKTLSGHVPSVVAHLTQIGDLAPTNNLHLAISLQLRNEAALNDLLRQVSDPASSQYRHYLTLEEFTRQFGPSEADYQAVIDFAREQGLAVTGTPANRMLVEVSGKASDVQKAFGVTLHTYQHPTENRTFFAPDSEPAVPASLAILEIRGLNNYARPYPNLRQRPNATTAPAATAPAATAPAATAPYLGSGMGGSYMGKDFRAAYVPGAPQTGAGQNVALVQFDGYFASDIALYESIAGLPNVTLTNILLNGFNGIPVTFNGNAEVSLDIEMVISMAPGVNEVEVYEGDPDNFFPDVVLNQIAVDNSAQQVSCSWGWTGGPDPTADQIFEEMILQGQTFFHASGDSDAFLPGEVDDPDLRYFPSSDPYITQVGGTTLSTAGPGGAFVSETVWNWDVEYGTNADGEGSCGGVSSYYTIPWWQTNVSMTANGGSTTHRNIPDVALTADNILVVAAGGSIMPGFGGTSCASPLWAGFTALVNQQSATEGHTQVGFINPAIYALAYSPSYRNVFRDVTTGSNTWSESTNLYVAVTNYDLCTGLGSPNGINLINALIPTNVVLPTPVIPAPKQPWGTTLGVNNGSNPNGLWFLFFQDDVLNGYWGTNYNGWMLNLTTANPVGFPADNQLFVSATNVSITPGSQWVTTLAVTNYGPSVSSNAFINDQLPAASGVTLVSYNSSIPSSSIDIVGGTLVWNIGALPVNAGGTLSLAFQGNQIGTYTNGATVYSATDPNPDDDSVGVAITVAPMTPPIISPHFLGAPSKGFSLSITNDAGYTVIIQASTNLVTWVPVETNVAPFTFTNFDNTNFSLRFYRALIEQ
jgi:hypothetical protein